MDVVQSFMGEGGRQAQVQSADYYTLLCFPLCGRQNICNIQLNNNTTSPLMETQQGEGRHSCSQHSTQHSSVGNRKTEFTLHSPKSRVTWQGSYNHSLQFTVPMMDGHSSVTRTVLSCRAHYPARFHAQLTTSCTLSRSPHFYHTVTVHSSQCQ